MGITNTPDSKHLSSWTFGALIIVSVAAWTSARAQRNQPSTTVAQTCAAYGAVARDGVCIYRWWSDCRSKPVGNATGSRLFQCPANTTCEPNTGMCLCFGTYKNSTSGLDDADGILTCVPGMGYGEPCNASIPCKKHMECSSLSSSTPGLCRCIEPAIWNSDTDECVSDAICKEKSQLGFFEPQTRQCKCELRNVNCIDRNGNFAYPCPINGLRHPPYFFREGGRRLSRMCLCRVLYTPADDNRSCVLK